MEEGGAVIEMIKVVNGREVMRVLDGQECVRMKLRSKR